MALPPVQVIRFTGNKTIDVGQKPTLGGGQGWKNVLHYHSDDWPVIVINLTWGELPKNVSEEAD